MKSEAPRPWLVLVYLAALVSAFGAPLVRADRICDGVHLPETVDPFGAPLRLNGAGLRRATFLNVHVYVAGLYLSQPTTDVVKILQPAIAKEIALYFVRDVSRAEMLDAIREGIDRNAGATKGAAEKHMASFARYLPDLRSGSRLRLSYEQTHGLEVRYAEKLLGVEKDTGFAQLLFRVWLGPKPPDEKLKARLLGGRCD